MAGAGIGLATGYGVYGAGKAAVAGGKALANKISAWRNSGKSEEAGDSGASGSEGNKQSDSLPNNQWASFAPQTQTGFEGFGSTPVGQQSPKIAAMARAVDAHNAGQSSAPAHKSPKIAAMAAAFDAHNQNPNGQNADPYEAGQAATQPQKPVKQPPKSLRNQQNNS
jgi:hypothetical protein